MKITKKTVLTVALGVFGLYLCIHYWPVAAGVLAALWKASMPLLIGGAIAFAVNIPMSFFEKYYFPKSNNRFVLRSRRPVCMTLAFLSVAAIVVLVISLVLPQLVSAMGIIIKGTPALIRKGLDFLAGHNILPKDILAALSSVDWQSKIGEIAGMVTTGLGSVMDVVLKTITSVFSTVVSTLISVIFAIYILSDKQALGRRIRRVAEHYLPEKVTGRCYRVLTVMNECFHSYLVGQCTEAVILGVLCTLGMLILRLPYAAMVGALIAFTALIPVAGAYIGAAVGAFMILTVSPLKALIFLIFIVVLQQLEGNLIYPKVVGSSVGLPAIWVLAAVTIGGSTMGVLGMLLAVPLAATAYRLLQNELNKPKNTESL